MQKNVSLKLLPSEAGDESVIKQIISHSLGKKPNGNKRVSHP